MEAVEASMKAVEAAMEAVEDSMEMLVVTKATVARVPSFSTPGFEPLARVTLYLDGKTRRVIEVHCFSSEVPQFGSLRPLQVKN